MVPEHRSSINSIWPEVTEVAAQALGFAPVKHNNVHTTAGLIHYVEMGVGDPVLLIHGGHGGWVHWIANIDGLARQRRVVALDLPGFGDSHTPSHRLDVSEYSAVVGSLIDALGLRNIALVGFSFGTFVAATLAAARPDAVSFLTLVNPPGIGERSAAAIAIPGRLSALAKEQGLKAGVAGTLKELMLHDSDQITAPLVDLIADCVARTRYETRSLSRKTQMIPLLENVTQRTMVLIGAEDPYQRHELGARRERINRALGAECVTIVDAAAHWLQYERAEFFNRAVLDFIDG